MDKRDSENHDNFFASLNQLILSLEPAIKEAASVSAAEDILTHLEATDENFHRSVSLLSHKLVHEVNCGSTKAEEGDQTSDFRLPTSDFRLPTSDFGLRTSDFGLRTSDFGLRTSDFGLRTSDFGLRTSDFRLENVIDMPTQTSLCGLRRSDA